LPKIADLKRYDREDLERLGQELKQSVQERIRKTNEMGSDKPHGERQAGEQRLLQGIRRLLGGRRGGR
jgi:hypothetical protein